MPATTLLFGKWLTEERPCRSVYFAGFFATWTISVNIQNEHDVFVFSSFARLRYNIILRRYSDYYVLRASFILLNLVCYVWLGFSSHWIALWSISNLWNAWRDVKLVLLVFTCGFGQTIFNCSRTHHFTGTVSNEATSDMGYPPGRTCDPISVFLQMWRRLSQELRGGVSTVVAIWDHLRSSQYFYMDFELGTSAQPSVQLALLRITQSYIPGKGQLLVVTFLVFGVFRWNFTHISFFRYSSHVFRCELHDGLLYEHRTICLCIEGIQFISNHWNDPVLV